jgi:nucleotide-binding universal stress UspA family protein
MFERIVLATDLSPAWDEIVACAGEFKTLGCSQVILTNVIVTRFRLGLEESLRADVRPKLERQQRQLEAQGFRVEVEIPIGMPAASLNDVASRHGADLIVAGSHGTALWREEVLGCFTSAMVHHIKFPTLLINVRVKKEQEAGTCRLHCDSLLRHILFPTDFSEISGRAGEFVERLATRAKGEVTLLTALDVPGGDIYPPGFQEIAETAARNSLEQWKQRLLKAGVPTVHDRFEPGHPMPAILSLLTSNNISLVVMGTQGKGFIQELFLGSVAHNVSRLATCPVLLVPSAQR